MLKTHVDFWLNFVFHCEVINHVIQILQGHRYWGQFFADDHIGHTATFCIPLFQQFINTFCLNLFAF